jgi:hypothetical protein
MKWTGQRKRASTPGIDLGNLSLTGPLCSALYTNLAQERSSASCTIFPSQWCIRSSRRAASSPLVHDLCAPSPRPVYRPLSSPYRFLPPWTGPSSPARCMSGRLLRCSRTLCTRHRLFCLAAIPNRRELLLTPESPFTRHRNCVAMDLPQ